MATLNSGYRTIQAENFESIEDDGVDTAANGSHRKFIALVVLLVVVAASLGTLFAVVS
jgi:hypothetical protein